MHSWSGQPGNDAIIITWCFTPSQPLRLYQDERKWCRHFFPILHQLSPVILAKCNSSSFVLLRNTKSSFSLHYYTQCEATPTQKSAWKWQLQHFATYSVKDYKGHSLMQTSLAKLPNSHPKRPSLKWEVKLSLNHLVHVKVQERWLSFSSPNRKKKRSRRLDTHHRLAAPKWNTNAINAKVETVV